MILIFLACKFQTSKWNTLVIYSFSSGIGDSFIDSFGNVFSTIFPNYSLSKWNLDGTLIVNNISGHNSVRRCISISSECGCPCLALSWVAGPFWMNFWFHWHSGFKYEGTDYGAMCSCVAYMFFVVQNVTKINLWICPNAHLMLDHPLVVETSR